MEEERRLPETGEGSEAPETQGEPETEDKDQIIERLREERDNYKRGLLAAKAKDLPPAEPEPKRKATGTEAAIERALAKVNERDAIAEVTDPESPHFIRECADPESWKQIVGYVPVGADRTTRNGIRKALRIAVEAWKIDTGRKDGEPNTAAADASAQSGVQSKSGESAKPVPATVPVQKRTDIGDWYRRKE